MASTTVRTYYKAFHPHCYMGAVCRGAALSFYFRSPPEKSVHDMALVFTLPLLVVISVPQPVPQPLVF
jgi:hypothetical protein